LPEICAITGKPREAPSGRAAICLCLERAGNRDKAIAKNRPGRTKDRAPARVATQYNQKSRKNNDAGGVFSG
jgi:hypothetical protein